MPQTEASEENFIDHQNEFDPYCEDHISDQDNLEYRHNYNKPTVQIEDEDIIDDSSLSDTPRPALLDLWTITSSLPGKSSKSQLTPFVQPKNKETEATTSHKQ